MNRNFQSPAFHFFCSSISSSLALAIGIVLLACLSSCDTGSKGRYKFKSESMHWLQFRGPNSSGIAPADANPPIHFNPDTSLLWKTEILPGWSSPCIVEDKIFLTGFKKEDSTLHTFAVNRENGEMLWDDSVKLWWIYNLHPINSYANPTVASDGKKVFSHLPGYGLIAYETDGTKCWEFKHQPLGFTMAGASSPIVKDSVVLVNINSRGDTRIVALDCETGDSLWVLNDPLHIKSLVARASSPVLWGDLLIMHQYQNVVAYNTLTGKAEWWLATPTTGVSTPVVYGDVMYLGSWTNFGEKSGMGLNFTFDDLLRDYDRDHNQKLEQSEMPDTLMIYSRPESSGEPLSDMPLDDDRVYQAVDGNKDLAIDSLEWAAFLQMLIPYFEPHGMMALPVTGSGELSASDVLWKVSDNTPETPSPLVVGNSVFFIKNGGIITVIDRETGEVVKNERVGAPGAYLSSPMLAGNRIYTCSYNGTVSVLSGDDFSILANNKLEGKIGASPVAVDDVLYVRTDKYLYAFREQ
ncbi:MAG: PQQ-binding-like beta-propeller repeat protein [Bacteroidales bacterium]|nr:PQQ-binding-like beta-propeller repeat protein [Bacteroidales bacterium]MCF8390792.1 PQQ-binding-like beta-propeller repeat protein [Bacteroidales bacterium]